MERVIKFRAWDKRHKVMCSFVEHVTWTDGSNAPTMIGYGQERYSLPSDAIALMQFTGLLDKTGKEIYEGDIVQCDRWPMPDDIALVAWGQLGWQPFLRLIERDEHVADLYEIIGNIYENPELLHK